MNEEYKELARQAYARSPSVKQKQESLKLKHEKLDKKVSLELNRKMVKPVKEILKELKVLEGLYSFKGSTLTMNYEAARALCKFVEPVFDFIVSLKGVVERKND